MILCLKDQLQPLIVLSIVVGIWEIILCLKDQLQPLRVLSTVAGISKMSHPSLSLKEQLQSKPPLISGIWEKSCLPLRLSGLVGNRSAWFGAEAASACGYERAALRRGIKSIIEFESVLAEIRELSMV